jgi:hypothetical protein
MSTFTLKRNDRGRSLSAQLLNGDGSVIDLTGSTVKFIMRLSGATTAKVNAAAVVVTAATGSVRYDWAAADTDTEGNYLAEWEITLPSSLKLTVPNQSYDQVIVVADLG